MLSGCPGRPGILGSPDGWQDLLQIACSGLYLAPGWLRLGKSGASQSHGRTCPGMAGTQPVLMQSKLKRAWPCNRTVLSLCTVFLQRRMAGLGDVKNAEKTESCLIDEREWPDSWKSVFSVWQGILSGFLTFLDIYGAFQSGLASKSAKSYFCSWIRGMAESWNRIANN